MPQFSPPHCHSNALQSNHSRSLSWKDTSRHSPLFHHRSARWFWFHRRIYAGENSASSFALWKTLASKYERAPTSTQRHASGFKKRNSKNGEMQLDCSDDRFERPRILTRSALPAPPPASQTSKCRHGRTLTLSCVLSYLWTRYSRFVKNCTILYWKFDK